MYIYIYQFVPHREYRVRLLATRLNNVVEGNYRCVLQVSYGVRRGSSREKAHAFVVLSVSQ
jgi:hypothetical protein